MATDEITIKAANNGFVVFPKKCYDKVCNDEEVNVFQTMAELIKYIESVFPFRAAALENDDCDTGISK